MVVYREENEICALFDDRALHADGELRRLINRRMEAAVVAIYT